MEIINEEGKNLARLRTQAQLTQKQLAMLCGIGTQYISDLERGVRKVSSISIRAAVPLADALHCEVRELLVKEEDPEK